MHWWWHLTDQQHGPLGWFFSVQGRWYGFWSGLGITAGGPLVYWRHQVCHETRCWRLGHHPDPYDPSWKRCSKHHVETRNVVK